MSENLLKFETSPYLRQHADNPVHWRPWGAAAMEEARARNVPILVSIGYAACHWCHVMAHESFEDQETADLMNKLFVCVKIDREERPDIDHIYMSALHALGEQGGWPLTMFATPDGAPFFGGTYYPPVPRYGRASFRQVLAAVDDAWRNRGAAVLKNAAAISAHLDELSASQSGDNISADDMATSAAQLLHIVDPQNGGIGGAPKFPNMPIFRFLWSEFFRNQNAQAASAARHLLFEMSQGGVYDHLGGGYARYSVDAQWHVPHFEKMLYDNAQALEMLSLAYAAEPDALYVARAQETVAWLRREMLVATPAGHAFAAAQDADQDGEEGLFYVWRAEEIDAALGDASETFKQIYDVRAEGNWEGKNVLRRRAHIGPPEMEARLAGQRAQLFALREARPKPARDDKILADWNGLMIAALAKAACVFGEPDWLNLAREAFAAIEATLQDENGDLAHAWLGRVSAMGQLDDVAATTRAALALFEATGQRAYLERARHLAQSALKNFGADDGGFYLVSSAAADVPGARPRNARDGATPSGLGVMSECLARLFALTGEAHWRVAAARAICSVTADKQHLPHMPGMLVAARLLDEARVCVIAGENSERLLRVARAAPDPCLAVLTTRDGADWPPESPAFARVSVDGKAAAYLCARQACGLPILHAHDLAVALEQRAAAT